MLEQFYHQNVLYGVKKGHEYFCLLWYNLHNAQITNKAKQKTFTKIEDSRLK